MAGFFSWDLLLVLISKMKRKAQHSSKSLKKICIEGFVNSAIPENTQKVTQLGMSAFTGDYSIFYVSSRPLSSVHSNSFPTSCSKLQWPTSRWIEHAISSLKSTSLLILFIHCTVNTANNFCSSLLYCTVNSM